MRIAVLGGGIVGVSAAEWLRRDGHAVTLIDRLDPGDPGQASYGNAGVLACNGVVPVPVPGLLAKAPAMLLSRDGPLFLRWRHLPRLMPWLRRYLRAGRLAEVERISRALADLVADTVDQHRSLAAGTPAERFLGTGRFVYLYRDRAGWEGDALGIRLRAAAGIAHRPLDRRALEAAVPGIGATYRFGIEYSASGHVTDPGAYVAALFGHFRGQGGAYLRAEVADLRPEGAAVAVEAGGALRRFDRAVLAMGAWSGRLAERLGHRAFLETERGYHLVLKGASRRPPGPLMLADAKIVAAPMQDGLRLAGLVEFGGLEAPPSQAPIRQIRRLVAELYPDLAWEGEAVWMGHRPSTPDSLPYISAAPGAPAICFAFGAQHLGLTTGPKTGRLVADLVAGRRPNIDLSPFRVGRFD